MTLIIALLLSYAAVGLACYEAGADAGKRAQWEAEQAQSRDRHPSRPTA